MDETVRTVVAVAVPSIGAIAWLATLHARVKQHSDQLLVLRDDLRSTRDDIRYVRERIDRAIG